MLLKLRLVGGKNAGQEIAVAGPVYSIGRAEGCQMRPRSDAIAPRHCDLVLEPGSVKVVDHGSAAGTLVNGQRVQGSQELKAGDALHIGPLQFEVVLGTSLSTKKKPKVANVEEAATRMAAGRRGEVDVAAWLGDADEATMPSRYAAKISDAELAALAPETQAVKQAAANEQAMKGETTGEAAQHMLDKFRKKS